MEEHPAERGISAKGRLGVIRVAGEGNMSLWQKGGPGWEARWVVVMFISVRGF
jgi:hypothetical protein